MAALVLHTAAAGRHQRRAARGQDVLSLVHVAGPRRADAVAVAVRAAHGKLEAVELEAGGAEEASLPLPAPTRNL